MRSRGKLPILLDPSKLESFPDPQQAEEHGLLAFGGDLSAERLLLAYSSGIFPWYDEESPVLWWSPNPRAIIEPDALHISHSLRRLLNRNKFRITLNEAFRQVMQECALRPGTGTWILPEMVDAYEQLFRQGHAHSLEVWEEDELVGGIYGVRLGGLFAAESMFHRRSNASKVALATLHCSLVGAGLVLFDVQFLTPHLSTMGATQIPRGEYLRRLRKAVSAPEHPLELTAFSEK